MSNTAFVLGNGLSRKGISVDSLKKHGKVWACNAVYRTDEPDVLVAVDPKMILEIAETDYVEKHEVWSNYNHQYSKNAKILNHVRWFKPSLGWSSGPTALRHAAESGYKNIYILGFDYQGLPFDKKTQRFKLNNIFGDTRNYKKNNDDATFYGNWMNQTKRVLNDFQQVEFVRVIHPTGFQPNDLNFFKNFKHIYIEDFCRIYNLSHHNS
jgi:hypothetical protein